MEARSTREEIAEELAASCPIRTLLKPGGKGCPYFGHSESCHSCMFPWQRVAHDVIAIDRLLIKKERVEREKRKKERLKAEGLPPGKKPL